jgi:hypothetical protein
MSTYDDPFDARRTGPRPLAVVRFDAIGEAWHLFQQRWSVWVLAALIELVCYGALGGLAAALLDVPRPPAPGGFRLTLPSQGQALQMALFLVLNGVFVGAMMRIACRQVRGQEFGVETLFSITDVLLNLILGSLLYGLACSVGLFFCFIPGVIVFGVLMFTYPLIVDAGLPPLEAMKQSWNSLKGQWLTVTVFHLLVAFLSGIGTCFCGIGLVVTAPLYSLSIAVLYRDFFLTKGASHSEKPKVPEADF